jgi:transposase InsO family protein
MQLPDDIEEQVAAVLGGGEISRTGNIGGKMSDGDSALEIVEAFEEWRTADGPGRSEVISRIAERTKLTRVLIQRGMYSLERKHNFDHDKWRLLRMDPGREATEPQIAALKDYYLKGMAWNDLEKGFGRRKCALREILRRADVDVNQPRTRGLGISQEKIAMIIAEGKGWPIGYKCIASNCRRYANIRGRPDLAPSDSEAYRVCKEFHLLVNKPLVKRVRTEIARYRAKNVGELWHCDLKGPIEIDGIPQRIFAIIDDRSKMCVFASAIRTKRARVTAEEPEETIANVRIEFEGRGIGMPRAMVLDNGTEFKGEFARLMTALGIDAINTAPYHPQTNGKIERLWGILMSLLMKKGDLTTEKVEEVVQYYSEVRTHAGLRAIGYPDCTPLDVWRQEALHWQYHLDNLGCEHWTEVKYVKERAREEGDY